jgi:hypothetical protein
MGSDEADKLREEIAVLRELMARALDHGHDEVMREAFRSVIREREEQLASLARGGSADESV